ncbi:phosphoserine transaminase [Schaalia suimastitidis]|uniref:phosphoserine transaminase n=1 Tax=Schaalia suimastitidis TaxID=121163 RepID=UPI00041FF33F|nr:phosphoserine transaminase [Schaalia suimastitidis]
MDITLPPTLLPTDGRFGCGPSRIRQAQIDAIASSGVMGTSHRQKPVKEVVASIRSGLAQLYRLPDGFEVVLGNGGATAFWAVAVASLIRHRSAHAVFGEFGAKFAQEAARAPHLHTPIISEAPAGSVALLDYLDTSSGPAPDVLAHPHHETSTGALSPITEATEEGQLLLVDATSIAGGIDVDVSHCDAYYFAPQKCFGSDGGLWVALVSPAAIERARELHTASDRWMPQFLDLSLAVDNSLKDQTLNTPALATLVMMEEQIQWMIDSGGLAAMETRSRAASSILYEWAAASGGLVTPFVEQEQWRSPVVVTLDFDQSINASTLASVLRANGVVDVEPYRSLGRNQLRIATFPATKVDDVHALITCLDELITALS